eukprot:g7085.t1
MDRILESTARSSSSTTPLAVSPDGIPLCAESRRVEDLDDDEDLVDEGVLQRQVLGLMKIAAKPDAEAETQRTPGRPRPADGDGGIGRKSAKWDKNSRRNPSRVLLAPLPTRELWAGSGADGAAPPSFFETVFGAAPCAARREARSKNVLDDAGKLGPQLESEWAELLFAGLPQMKLPVRVQGLRRNFVLDLARYLQSPSSIVSRCKGRILVGTNGLSAIVHPAWREILYSGRDLMRIQHFLAAGGRLVVSGSAQRAFAVGSWFKSGSTFPYANVGSSASMQAAFSFGLNPYAAPFRPSAAYQQIVQQHDQHHGAIFAGPHHQQEQELVSQEEQQLVPQCHPVSPSSVTKLLHSAYENEGDCFFSRVLQNLDSFSIDYLKQEVLGKKRLGKKKARGSRRGDAAKTSSGRGGGGATATSAGGDRRACRGEGIEQEGKEEVRADVENGGEEEAEQSDGAEEDEEGPSFALEDDEILEILEDAKQLVKQMQMCSPAYSYATPIAAPGLEYLGTPLWSSPEEQYLVARGHGHGAVHDPEPLNAPGDTALPENVKCVDHQPRSNDGARKQESRLFDEKNSITSNSFFLQDLEDGDGGDGANEDDEALDAVPPQPPPPLEVEDDVKLHRAAENIASLLDDLMSDDDRGAPRTVEQQTQTQTTREMHMVDAIMAAPQAVADGRTTYRTRSGQTQPEPLLVEDGDVIVPPPPPPPLNIELEEIAGLQLPSASLGDHEIGESERGQARVSRPSPVGRTFEPTPDCSPLYPVNGLLHGPLTFQNYPGTSSATRNLFASAGEMQLAEFGATGGGGGGSRFGASGMTIRSSPFSAVSGVGGRAWSGSFDHSEDVPTELPCGGEIAMRQAPGRSPSQSRTSGDGGPFPQSYGGCQTDEFLSVERGTSGCRSSNNGGSFSAIDLDARFGFLGFSDAVEVGANVKRRGVEVQQGGGFLSNPDEDDGPWEKRKGKSSKAEAAQGTAKGRSEAAAAAEGSPPHVVRHAKGSKRGANAAEANKGGKGNKTGKGAGGVDRGGKAKDKGGKKKEAPPVAPPEPQLSAAAKRRARRIKRFAGVEGERAAVAEVRVTETDAQTSSAQCPQRSGTVEDETLAADVLATNPETDVEHPQQPVPSIPPGEGACRTGVGPSSASVTTNSAKAEPLLSNWVRRELGLEEFLILSLQDLLAKSSSLSGHVGGAKQDEELRRLRADVENVLRKLDGTSRPNEETAMN